MPGIENEKERDDMKDELLDRFGQIPDSVENLLSIALIREAAHKLYITEIRGQKRQTDLKLCTQRPGGSFGDPASA